MSLTSGIIALQSVECQKRKWQHVVVATRLLPRDGGMAEDHAAPEVEQPPRASTRGRRERERERQRVAKERAAPRVRSCTVQNEMRGILGRVSASAARRVLDSANPRKIKA